MLQSRFHIISQPGRVLSMDIMADIVTCCGILHNMGVEERENTEGRYFPKQDQAVDFNMGENAVSMWGKLEPDEETTHPPPGSLAALCELNVFTGN